MKKKKLSKLASLDRITFAHIINGKPVTSQVWYRFIKQVIVSQPGCKIIDTDSMLVYQYNTL